MKWQGWLLHLLNVSRGPCLFPFSGGTKRRAAEDPPALPLVEPAPVDCHCLRQGISLWLSLQCELSLKGWHQRWFPFWEEAKASPFKSQKVLVRGGQGVWGVCVYELLSCFWHLWVVRFWFSVCSVPWAGGSFSFLCGVTLLDRA